VDRAARFLIRISSFLQKEMVDIMRQPRLILTLVLGPFLILLLFGIGFQATPRKLDTVFVVPADSPLRDTIRQYATTLGPQLVFSGFITDTAEGIQMVQTGQIDLLVVVPPDIPKMLDNFERPTLELYHNELDPIQADYVRIFGQRYVDEVNRRVLQQVIVDTQRQALDVQQQLQAAHQSAQALQAAADAGDQAAVQQYRQELTKQVTQLMWTVGASVQLYNRLQNLAGDGTAAPSASEVLAQLQRSLEAISAPATNQQTSQGAQAIDQQLTDLESLLGQFVKVEPIMLVSPFQVETKSVAPVALGPSEYYSPAVIVLLLQHLCVTVGGLSMVMERRMGTMEIFRVAPLSAIEIILGKYLSLGLFAVAVGEVLTVLTVFALGVPMLGGWATLSLVISVLVFTSLGIGFIISLISETTSQVVQYSMIVLLASVFFTGFFLGLESFHPFVQGLSWALPATYGNDLLRDVMLRGRRGDLRLLLYLGLYGIGLIGAAWLLLRRSMRQD
jgi:ABC-2 type transport system permease protein